MDRRYLPQLVRGEPHLIRRERYFPPLLHLPLLLPRRSSSTFLASTNNAPDTLHKTEVTGNKDIDGIQHSVNEAVGNTVGQNGLAGGVGNLLDKNVMKGRTG